MVVGMDFSKDVKRCPTLIIWDSRVSASGNEHFHDLQYVACTGLDLFADT
jgi:hypothetical protein